MAEASSLEDVLEELSHADHGSAISVGDVLKSLKDRSLGVLLTGLGLIASLPVVGAIPGVSVLVGAPTLGAVVHSTFGKNGLWALERCVGEKCRTRSPTRLLTPRGPMRGAWIEFSRRV